MKAELNERITRIGPGTPCGQLMRHYWQPVALVDEFQDTSPLQLQVFDAIYRLRDNSDETTLLLIGDPKQSIYGFRGADIHSYLQARRATEGRHHVLGTNHRSTTEVVSVVNHFFALGQALAGGAFDYREDA